MARRLISFRERLVRDLDDIEREFQALLDISTIRYINPNRADSSVLFVGASDYGWGPADDAQHLARMKLDRDYDAWYARFASLFGGITPELKKSIAKADRFVRSWITRSRTWDGSIPRTIPEAKVRATKGMAPLREALDLLSRQGGGGLRVIPDTSALMDLPDLTGYALVLNTKTFTVHLLPQVLAELDSLKDRGRPDQQKRARMALHGRGLASGGGFRRSPNARFADGPGGMVGRRGPARPYSGFRPLSSPVDAVIRRLVAEPSG